MKCSRNCKHSTRLDAGLYTCRIMNSTYCEEPENCKDYNEVKE